jgi:hypothetical protein
MKKLLLIFTLLYSALFYGQGLGNPTNPAWIRTSSGLEPVPSTVPVVVSGTINATALKVGGVTVGPATTYSYSAGSGLGLSGNTFSLNTFTNIAVTNSVTANGFYATDGSSFGGNVVSATTVQAATLRATSGVQLPNGVITLTNLATNINGTVQNIASSSAITVNCSSGSISTVTLTASTTTVTVTNQQQGQSGYIVFKQDGTGGRLVALSIGDLVIGGTGTGTPTLSIPTTANAQSVVGWLFINNRMYWNYDTREYK